MKDVHAKYNQQRRSNNGKITSDLERKVEVLHGVNCGLYT